MAQSAAGKHWHASILPDENRSSWGFVLLVVSYFPESRAAEVCGKGPIVVASDPLGSWAQPQVSLSHFLSLINY